MRLVDADLPASRTAGAEVLALATIRVLRQIDCPFHRALIAAVTDRARRKRPGTAIGIDGSCFFDLIAGRYGGETGVMIHTGEFEFPKALRRHEAIAFLGPHTANKTQHDLPEMPA